MLRGFFTRDIVSFRTLGRTLIIAFYGLFLTFGMAGTVVHGHSEIVRSLFPGKPVTVAVLDTGVDSTHIDLQGKVVATYNFTGSPTVEDLRGHGTHIAGIIVRDFEANVGRDGLRHDVRLINVKVAEDSGICRPETVSKGIIWAADNGAEVINISLALRQPMDALEESIRYAWSKGAVIVAAAGNENLNLPIYPAAYPQVMGVAATDDTGQLTNWSNRGNWVSVSAPGTNIYSTLPGNAYGFKSGTSQAAAFVSSEAAVIYVYSSEDDPSLPVNATVAERVKEFRRFR
jgi:thermitase